MVAVVVVVAASVVAAAVGAVVAVDSVVVVAVVVADSVVAVVAVGPAEADPKWCRWTCGQRFNSPQPPSLRLTSQSPPGVAAQHLGVTAEATLFTFGGRASGFHWR